jgi:hypothetical protein
LWRQLACQRKNCVPIAGTVQVIMIKAAGIGHRAKNN